MAFFSTLTSCAVLLLYNFAIAQDVRPCFASDFAGAIELTDLINLIDFDACSSSIGIDFDKNIPEFLQALTRKCTSDACKEGFKEFLLNIDSVSRCTINPSGDTPILLSDAIIDATKQCFVGPVTDTCTDVNFQSIIDAMNSVAEDDFNTCINAVGVDFNTDLVQFLIAVNSDCSEQSCATAMAKVAGVANQVSNCSIDNPLNPGEEIAVVDIVRAVAGTCVGSSSGIPLPDCTGDDVQAIIDTMNTVAEDDFNTCVNAVGTDFNTNLIGFFVAVNGDCSERSCASAIGEVVAVADQVPSCIIVKPPSPGKPVAVVDVLGVVSGACGAGSSGSDPDLIDVGGGDDGSTTGGGASDSSLASSSLDSLSLAFMVFSYLLSLLVA